MTDVTAAAAPGQVAGPAEDSREAASSSSGHSHSAHAQHTQAESGDRTSSSVASSSSSSSSLPPVDPLSSSLAAVSLSCQPLPASSLVDGTFDLYGDHLVWLQLMQQRYHISSPSKAARILLTYIHSLPPATQRSVFTRIRCKHCGLRQTKRPTTFSLYPHQQQWMRRWAAEWAVAGGESKVMRIVCDYVQWGERRRGMADVEVREMLEAMERNIFTVVRCQDPLCTQQHGTTQADGQAATGTPTKAEGKGGNV